MKKTATAVALALSMSAPALAEGWTATDLGSVSSLQQCMIKSETVGYVVLEDFGAHSVSPSAWTVSVYDLGNDNDFDANFVCARTGNGDTHRAILVLYSVGNGQTEERIMWSERFEQIWEQN